MLLDVSFSRRDAKSGQISSDELEVFPLACRWLFGPRESPLSPLAPKGDCQIVVARSDREPGSVAEVKDKHAA